MRRDCCLAAFSVGDRGLISGFIFATDHVNDYKWYWLREVCIFGTLYHFRKHIPEPFNLGRVGRGNFCLLNGFQLRVQFKEGHLASPESSRSRIWKMNGGTGCVEIHGAASFGSTVPLFG